MTSASSVRAYPVSDGERDTAAAKVQHQFRQHQLRRHLRRLRYFQLEEQGVRGDITADQQQTHEYILIEVEELKTRFNLQTAEGDARLMLLDVQEHSRKGTEGLLIRRMLHTEEKEARKRLQLHEERDAAHTSLCCAEQIDRLSSEEFTVRHTLVVAGVTGNEILHRKAIQQKKRHKFVKLGLTLYSNLEACARGNIESTCDRLYQTTLLQQWERTQLFVRETGWRDLIKRHEQSGWERIESKQDDIQLMYLYDVWFNGHITIRNQQEVARFALHLFKCEMEEQESRIQLELDTLEFTETLKNRFMAFLKEVEQKFMDNTQMIVKAADEEHLVLQVQWEDELLQFQVKETLQREPVARLIMQREAEIWFLRNYVYFLNISKQLEYHTVGCTAIAEEEERERKKIEESWNPDLTRVDIDILYLMRNETHQRLHVVHKTECTDRNRLFLDQIEQAECVQRNHVIGNMYDEESSLKETINRSELQHIKEIVEPRSRIVFEEEIARKIVVDEETDERFDDIYIDMCMVEQRFKRSHVVDEQEDEWITVREKLDEQRLQLVVTSEENNRELIATERGNEEKVAQLNFECIHAALYLYKIEAEWWKNLLVQADLCQQEVEQREVELLCKFVSAGIVETVSELVCTLSTETEFRQSIEHTSMRIYNQIQHDCLAETFAKINEKVEAQALELQQYAVRTDKAFQKAWSNTWEDFHIQEQQGREAIWERGVYSPIPIEAHILYITFHERYQREQLLLYHIVQLPQFTKIEELQNLQRIVINTQQEWDQFALAYYHLQSMEVYQRSELMKFHNTGMFGMQWESAFGSLWLSEQFGRKVITLSEHVECHSLVEFRHRLAMQVQQHQQQRTLVKALCIERMCCEEQTARRAVLQQESFLWEKNVMKYSPWTVLWDELQRKSVEVNELQARDDWRYIEASIRLVVESTILVSQETVHRAALYNTESTLRGLCTLALILHEKLQALSEWKEITNCCVLKGGREFILACPSCKESLLFGQRLMVYLGSMPVQPITEAMDRSDSNLPATNSGFTTTSATEKEDMSSIAAIMANTTTFGVMRTVGLQPLLSPSTVLASAHISKHMSLTQRSLLFKHDILDCGPSLQDTLSVVMTEVRPEMCRDIRKMHLMDHYSAHKRRQTLLSRSGGTIAKERSIATAIIDALNKNSSTSWSTTDTEDAGNSFHAWANQINNRPNPNIVKYSVPNLINVLQSFLNNAWAMSMQLHKAVHTNHHSAERESIRAHYLSTSTVLPAVISPQGTSVPTSSQSKTGSTEKWGNHPKSETSECSTSSSDEEEEEYTPPPAISVLNQLLLEIFENIQGSKNRRLKIYLIDAIHTLQRVLLYHRNKTTQIPNFGSDIAEKIAGTHLTIHEAQEARQRLCQQHQYYELCASLACSLNNVNSFYRDSMSQHWPSNTDNTTSDDILRSPNSKFLSRFPTKDRSTSKPVHIILNNTYHDPKHTQPITTEPDVGRMHQLNGHPSPLDQLSSLGVEGFWSAPT